MPVRTAYDPTAGEVLTAVNLEKLAGGWIGYNETVTAQTGISAATDLTSLTLTVTVGTSRRIRVSCHVLMTQSTSAGQAEVDIYEGATRLQRAFFNVSATGVAEFSPSVVLTPTAGPHTYNLKALTTAGTVGTEAASQNPAYIAVEDLGATP